MAESQGFKTWFRPFLEDKLNQSFPDPSQFTSEADFTYAAKTASVFKKVIAELLSWVDQNIAAAKDLDLKSKGEIKDNFDLEGGE